MLIAVVGLEVGSFWRVVLEMREALGYSIWVVKMECSIFSSSRQGALG
jgi:hypothetical protein